jgi:hypothetical protein
MAEGMMFMSQVKSAMTAVLMGIPWCDQDFPLIFQYISSMPDNPMEEH